MPRVVHIIGNGDNAALYNNEPRKGLKLTCNVPPFEVPDAYASCIVDFKMMNTIMKGEIDVPGEWIVGFRPKLWMQKYPNFFMQRTKQIKEFFTELPKYAANYTDFNCGHMATYYAAFKLKADEINLYGFDSLFDFNLRSYTDLFLSSPRDAGSNQRLANNWRPIWQGMFNEYKDTKFVLHHSHDKIKFPVPKNVEIKVYSKKKKAS